MTRYWTSDLHFCHNRIVEHTKRGVDTSQEDHDGWLIKKINSQVNPKDTVVHLGDFCFKWSHLNEIMDQLNGHWIFVLGNHDDETRMRRAAQELGQVRDVYKTKIHDVFTTCFHYPIGSWEKQKYGSYHLHGHSHGNYGRADEGRILDVGLDSAYKLFGEHRLLTDFDIHNFMLERPIYKGDTHRGSNEP